MPWSVGSATRAGPFPAYTRVLIRLHRALECYVSTLWVGQAASCCRMALFKARLCDVRCGVKYLLLPFTQARPRDSNVALFYGMVIRLFCLKK
jgi:tRNA isopentenyl-2-thiomethyl-A-37 hydroxylase MiaE